MISQSGTGSDTKLSDISFSSTGSDKGTFTLVYSGYVLRHDIKVTIKDGDSVLKDEKQKAEEWVFVDFAPPLRVSANPGASEQTMSKMPKTGDKSVPAEMIFVFAMLILGLAIKLMLVAIRRSK